MKLIDQQKLPAGAHAIAFEPVSKQLAVSDGKELVFYDLSGGKLTQTRSVKMPALASDEPWRTRVAFINAQTLFLYRVSRVEKQSKAQTHFLTFDCQTGAFSKDYIQSLNSGYGADILCPVGGNLVLLICESDSVVCLDSSSGNECYTVRSRDTRPENSDSKSTFVDDNSVMGLAYEATGERLYVLTGVDSGEEYGAFLEVYRLNNTNFQADRVTRIPLDEKNSFAAQSLCLSPSEKSVTAWLHNIPGKQFGRLLIYCENQSDRVIDLPRDLVDKSTVVLEEMMEKYIHQVTTLQEKQSKKKVKVPGNVFQQRRTDAQHDTTSSMAYIDEDKLILTNRSYLIQVDVNTSEATVAKDFTQQIVSFLGDRLNHWAFVGCEDGTINWLSFAEKDSKAGESVPTTATANNGFSDPWSEKLEAALSALRSAKLEASLRDLSEALKLAVEAHLPESAHLSDLIEEQLDDLQDFFDDEWAPAGADKEQQAKKDGSNKEDGHSKDDGQSKAAEQGKPWWKIW